MRDRGKWGSHSHLDSPQQYGIRTKSLPSPQTLSDPQKLRGHCLGPIACNGCWQGHVLHGTDHTGCHHGIARQGQRWLLASAPFTSENALGHFPCPCHGTLSLCHWNLSELWNDLSTIPDLGTPNLFLPTMAGSPETGHAHLCQLASL